MAEYEEGGGRRRGSSGSVNHCGHGRGLYIYLCDPDLYLHDPVLYLHNPDLYLHDPDLYLYDPDLYWHDPDLNLHGPDLYWYDLVLVFARSKSVYV